MSDDDETVECDEHGKQQQTFVCVHIVNSLNSGEQVGFVSFSKPGNARPDAWCETCNVAFEKYGEWNDVNEKLTDIQILCGICYDRAKAQNLRP